MLGWHISLYRQGAGGAAPATFDSAQGDRLAVWQTGFSGLDWVDDLVKQGKAVNLGGNGYPCRYTAMAGVVIPVIGKSPPGARAVWASGPGDVLTSKWAGKTVLDEAGLAACRPDEWLLLEAWDES